MRRWLWLVTENCRGICPIFYRGSDDAAWITCSPLPATVDRRGDAGRLLHRLQQEQSGARLFLLRGRPEGDRLLIDPLEFVSGSKSPIQRIEEARLKGVWSPAQRRLSQ